MKDFKCGVTPDFITELKVSEIFVFGSNLQGIWRWSGKDSLQEVWCNMGTRSRLTGTVSLMAYLPCREELRR